MIKAAEVLANRPKSKVAAENMEVFRSAWEAQLSLLTDAVDDLVTMELPITKDEIDNVCKSISRKKN